MANTFTPKKGVTYYNKTGPNQGVTAGPTRQSPRNTQQATYYAPQNYQAPSGGGSAGGSPVQSAPAAPQGPSQEDLMREIDNVYSGSMDYLNQAENAVRADYPSAMEAAQKEFDTNQGLLTNKKTAGLNELSTQEQQGTRRKEDAMSAARRLLGELQQGAQQRFGGSSSAGLAAFELAGRESQRQFGDISNKFGDFQQVIGQKRAEVEDSYQTGLVQLEQAKQSSIRQATQDFQNKLLEIANNRAQIGQAKAQARLEALQDLRNKVYAIQLQNQQFQQTLQLQRGESLNSLNAYGTQVSGATQAGQGALTDYGSQTSTNPQSSLTYGGGRQAPQGQNLIGQIRRPDDEFNFGLS
jgi:hypothetical protein